MSGRHSCGGAGAVLWPKFTLELEGCWWTWVGGCSPALFVSAQRLSDEALASLWAHLGAPPSRSVAHVNLTLNADGRLPACRSFMCAIAGLEVSEVKLACDLTRMDGTTLAVWRRELLRYLERTRSRLVTALELTVQGGQDLTWRKRSANPIFNLASRSCTMRPALDGGRYGACATGSAKRSVLAANAARTGAQRAYSASLVSAARAA